MATYKIAVLGGDGIGQEVTPEAQKVLQVVGKATGAAFEFEPGLVGGAAIDATGGPLPEATLELCKQSHAILFGSVGGPKWDNVGQEVRPERGLLRIRKELDLFANLRPATCFPMLIDASPLKRSVVEGTDLMVVRELTGGLYYGEPRSREKDPAGGERAINTMTYTTREIERVARAAFDVAMKRRRKLASVDKSNVLIVSQLWRDVVNRVAADYPAVELEHILVDNCAMALVQHPTRFDTIVAENTFGDILSDEAAILAGSMGMLPSASLGGSARGQSPLPTGGRSPLPTGGQSPLPTGGHGPLPTGGHGPLPIGLYEPVHGTAPDIAGKGIANPIAAILSASMLLRYSLDRGPDADRVDAAVLRVLEEGHRTADIKGDAKRAVGTTQMGDLIARQVEASY